MAKKAKVTPKGEPFTKVNLPKFYPSDEIAPHEVFMSFVNDDDAFDFRTWWAWEGAVAFNEWLKSQEGQK